MESEPIQGELPLPHPVVERSWLADLLPSARLYHSSKDYKALLDFVTRLRNFASFNAMLLQAQKPGLTYAASAWNWRTHGQRELEAESLACLVAKRHGVASKSESYLADYVAANTKVDHLDLDTLFKAAGQMETALGIEAETLFEPRPRPPRRSWRARAADPAPATHRPAT